MRGGLAVVMVVFRCWLLFTFVFYIQVTHCKPVNDEKAEVSGIGSTLWGWVTYVIPWGSTDTSDTAMLEKNNNSKQIKNEPVVESRKFTAATIPVNPSTAKVSTLSIDVSDISDDCMGLQVTNTHKSVLTSDQNNLTWERNSVAYSTEPTVLNAQVQYNPTRTEESVTEFNLEIEVPATFIVLARDNSTSTEESIIDAAVATTPTALDLENLTTTEKPAKELPLEPEVFTHVSAQNISKITEEVATDLLRLEATTTLILMDQNIPMTQKNATEQIFEQEATTISIVMNTDYPTKVEEPVEPKVSKQVLTLNTTNTSIVLEEPAIDHLLSALPTLTIAMDPDFTISAMEFGMETLSMNTSPTNNPATATDNPLVLETSTILSIDENSTKTIEEIPLEQSLELEAPTTEHLLEVQVSTKAVSTLIFVDEQVFSAQQYKTHMETDEPLNLTQPTFPSLREQEVLSKQVNLVSNTIELATDSYMVVDEVLSKVDEVPISTGPNKDPCTRLHEDMFIPFEEVSVLTEPATDSYANLDETMLKPVGESTNAYAEVHHAILDPPIFTESVTVSYPEVKVVYQGVSDRNEDSPEISEEPITTASATRWYLGVDMVSEREEVTLAEPVTRIEVPLSTELALYQLLEVKETMPMEVNNMPVELNAVLRTANEATPTENHEGIAIATPRYSRSHGAGSRLCFNHMRFIFLFYALYSMKALE